jgi:hypothetical protein
MMARNSHLPAAVAALASEDGKGWPDVCTQRQVHAAAARACGNAKPCRRENAASCIELYMCMGVAMSISSVSNSPLTQPYPTAQRTTKATAATSNGTTDPGAASSASTVTLSADAQAMARLNAMGVTIETVKVTGLSRGGLPLPPPGGANGSLSQSSFQDVLEGYGASAQQAEAAFSAADQDGNGSISNGELLGAMSSTGNSTSAAAQRLLQLMDTNHDGSVSSTEFVSLETAMVQAETPTA